MLAALLVHAASAAPPPLPSPDPACNVMPLVALRDASGGLTRLFVRVERNGSPALLMFDTGAPKTVLTHASSSNPSDVRDAGRVKLFCTDRSLTSVPKASVDGSVEGLPIIGNLGTDILDAGILEVDASRKIFALRPLGVPGSDTWTKLPFSIASGVPVADVLIDHRSYRVEWDTGGYRTFLFDRNADMSPPVSITHDWVGNEIVMKESPAELVLGNGAPRLVLLDRSRRYPVFEGWMASTGIVGAIGISSLGADHFVIDQKRGEIRIALPPAPLASAAPNPPPSIEATCTAEGHGNDPGNRFTYRIPKPNGDVRTGATRCGALHDTPICVSRIIDSKSIAACCPSGRTSPTEAGCVSAVDVL